MVGCDVRALKVASTEVPQRGQTISAYYEALTIRVGLLYVHEVYTETE